VLVSDSLVALVLIFTSLWPIIGTPMVVKLSEMMARPIRVDSSQE
jgi:hypothetical protein